MEPDDEGAIPPRDQTVRMDESEDITGGDEFADDEIIEEDSDGPFDELPDSDLAPEDEFEYDQRPEDQIPVTLFDPAALGLKEINNLAHFSVSSHKPGNGVQELLSDDLDKYWQSDGQQPHLLTIHFLRRVEIRAIRFYVDYTQDESYTPIFVVFSAGTGHHDLIEFSSMPLNNPVGWQEVDLADVGGGDDGKALCCWLVQMQIKENHQNGKDTHIRAIKLYGVDENAVAHNEDGAMEELEDLIDAAAGRAGLGDDVESDELEIQRLQRLTVGQAARSGGGGMGLPDFMRDPEIR